MEKALFRNNLIKKITAALMIVMLLIPYCFAQVTFVYHSAGSEECPEPAE